MKVAITGELSVQRREAITLMESKTSARFSKSVSLDTDYLVSTRKDTEKARRAAELGVPVISEADFWRFVERGSFPETQVRHRERPNNVPEIEWTEFYEPPLKLLVEYRDADDVVTERIVYASSKGFGSNGSEYLGARDAERLKTFRMDRIISLREIRESDNAHSGEHAERQSPVFGTNPSRKAVESSQRRSSHKFIVAILLVLAAILVLYLLARR